MAKELLLALDQSSRCTGYAVFEGEELTESGTFTLSDSDFGKRLESLRKKVLELIDQFKITKAAIEDIQLQSNANPATYKALAEVLGVLEELFTELSIPYEIVHSQSWKSALGIGGRKRTEQKKNAQEFVQTTYNKQVSSDESDAICIGTYVIKETESAF